MDSFSFGTSQKWLFSRNKKGRVLAQSPGDSTFRDTYGFQIPSQFVEAYRKQSRVYQVEEEERSARWETFLATYGVSQVPQAQFLSELKTLVSEGAPEKLHSASFDAKKLRGQGGDASFKSDFRPELWLVERALHAKILSSNGKAKQMDTVAASGRSYSASDALALHPNGVALTDFAPGCNAPQQADTESSSAEGLREGSSGADADVDVGRSRSEPLHHDRPPHSSASSYVPSAENGQADAKKEKDDCAEAEEKELRRRLSFRDPPGSGAHGQEAELPRGSSGDMAEALSTADSMVEDGIEGLTLERLDELGPREFSWAAWAQELNSLVMGGVPMNLRGEVWQIFAGTKSRRIVGLYDSLLAGVHTAEAEAEAEAGPGASLGDIYARLQKKDSRHAWAVQIEKDLPRTFPGHPALDSIGRDSLRRLLTAYACKCPEIGYCQGMNFLGGLLLLLMPEENAFWTLCGLIDDYLQGYYSDDMVEAQVDQLVFEELVRQNFPRLASHLDGLGVQISWVTGPWFLSVFVNVLPWESVLRVWDVMLYQRSRSMLFRTALALLEMHSISLLDCRDTGDIMANMQGMTGGTFDSSELVLRACVGYMDVDDDVLEELRVKHRPAVHERLEERRQALAQYSESQRRCKEEEMRRKQQQEIFGEDLGQVHDDMVLPSAVATPTAERKLLAESHLDAHPSGLLFPPGTFLPTLPAPIPLTRSSSLSRLHPNAKSAICREVSAAIKRLLMPKSRATAVSLLRSSTLIHRPLVHLQSQMWNSDMHSRQHKEGLAGLTPAAAGAGAGHEPLGVKPVGRSPLVHLLRHHSDASGDLLAQLLQSPPLTLSNSVDGGLTVGQPLPEPSTTSLTLPSAFRTGLKPIAEQGQTAWDARSPGSSTSRFFKSPVLGLEEQLKKEKSQTAELREQVEWLKEQLVLTLEAEQEASLRANELQSALVEMAERDNSQSLAVKVETMESEIEALKKELERQQARSAEVLAGALAEKEKQAEEDLKQLLVVLAAKEDHLQMDVDSLQGALQAREKDHDRLMKEVSRLQLAAKEKDEQLQANEQQVETQKNVIDMLAEKNKSLLKELEVAKEKAASAEGMLKAYLQAGAKDKTYSAI